MKTIPLLALLGLLFVGTSCQKPAAENPAAMTETQIRQVAEKAMREIVSSDSWRRYERADRQRLSAARSPGDVELASVDLKKTMQNAEEDAAQYDGVITELHAATKGKPPYWQAIEGFRSAVGMANDDEKNRLRTLTLDQVVAEFGVNVP